MKFIIVAAAYGFIFVVVEVLAARLHPPRETARKMSHMLAGVGASLLPFVLSFPEIALLGVLFIPAVIISMRSGMFKSIHGVRRSTYGEVYFPLAIALCAIMFPDALFFMYGVLTLGLSDALASLFGQRYGRKKHKGRSNKTYVGSTVFFISTFVIGFTLVELFTDASPISTFFWTAGLAGILTYIEARGKKGLDNLFVPIAASGMLGFLYTIGLLGN